MENIKIKAEVIISENPLSPKKITKELILTVIDCKIINSEVYFYCLDPLTNHFHMVAIKDAINIPESN